MYIQEVLNKRGVHQSQKLRLLLQYSPLARYMTRRFVCATPLWKCEYVRLCCAMPSIRWLLLDDTKVKDSNHP